jgi:hypothetical protein
MTKMSSRAIILKLESKSFLSFYNGFFIITLSALGQFGIWLKIKNKKQKKKDACMAPRGVCSASCVQKLPFYRVVGNTVMFSSLWSKAC